MRKLLSVVLFGGKGCFNVYPGITSNLIFLEEGYDV